MFFPIFIPVYNDCDHDKKHGYGCKCPKCLEKEKYASMPKEYYETRYAIPKKWYIKNQLFKVLSFIPIALWLLVSSFCIFNIFSLHVLYFWYPITILLGAVLAVFLHRLLDKFVKLEINCEEAILLKKIRFTNETWENIFKKSGVSKDKYYMTKPRESWRYK